MKACPQHSTAKHEGGFTLVEVLAALSVFAIAGIGLVHVSTENTRTAQFIEQRALAAIVADNHLAETLLSEAPLIIGRQSTDLTFAARNWVSTATIKNTANPLILEIVIEAQPLDADGDPQGGSVVRTAFRRAGE